MFLIDQLMLLASVLLLVGILSSKLFARVGLPVLLLFLVVGMLAGSEGPGGIAFENYPLAHGLGTLALCFILFDGGLSTNVAGFRRVLWPSLTLATLGVVLTAVLTAAVARLFADLTWLQALLLGSIVGSTDAAAVFAAFRSQNMQVGEKLTLLIESESGANDPMAVFMTIACVELLLGQSEPGLSSILLFIQQMVLGAAVGGLVGRVTSLIVGRIELSATGLYPAFTGSAALLAYGLAASIGGSGFLSAYLAGMTIGAYRLPFGQGVRLFHDGLAWLAQIAMFIVLGLLTFPSRLVTVGAPALGIAAGLIFIARPIAVGLCMLPFGTTLREWAFVSWAGLKGAVPIVLATYPLMLGLNEYGPLFDIVFFVVLVSAVVQGWSLPFAATILGLRKPAAPNTGITLEIGTLRDVDGEIVEYSVGSDTPAVGHRIRDLSLPEGVVVAMLVREQKIVPPRGSSQILAGDHVFVILRPEIRTLVDRFFGTTAPPKSIWSPKLEFPLQGTARVADLERYYGLAIAAPKESSLADLITLQLGAHVRVGEELRIGSAVLSVREIVEGHIETVGLSFRELPGPDANDDP